MTRRKRVALCYVLMLLIAFLAMCSNSADPHLAGSAMPLEITFEGDYKIGDGSWQPIVKGEHISATRGDVTLRGWFYMWFPDGTSGGPMEPGDRLALYFNHIGCKVYADGRQIRMFDAEHPLLGREVCGKYWTTYTIPDTGAEELELVLKNPHSFGNEIAVDDFLESIYVYSGLDFQQARRMEDRPIQIVGFAVVTVSMILIGVAVFATLLGMRQRGLMWQVGITSVIGGCFCIATQKNLSIWSSGVSANTTFLLITSMLYLITLQCLIYKCFATPYRRHGFRILIFSWCITGLVLLASALTRTGLYDLIGAWTDIQCLVNLVLLVFSLASIRYSARLARIMNVAFSVTIAMFYLDILATFRGWWQGGLCSRGVFLVLFAIALITVLYVLPMSIRTALRAKEVQAELERNRTAIMLSQIQPHFLYNSLGAIRELCRQDPEEAREALRIFTMYLRSNMDSLKSERPIHFSRELSHIEAYLKLEQLRFGSDLKVVYDIQEDDFFLPSLTIQPLVENAVKHGICGREEGGTLTLHTHREENRVVVTVTDDGVGFDPDVPMGQEHVGIANVRSRLEHMVGGRLILESTPGEGTVATVLLER